GIAVTSANSSNGTWQCSTDGGSTWTNVGAVANTSALLLRASDSLRFVPDGQNGTAASVTFRAWDQTTGTAGTNVDTSANGGVMAFSAATASASITVTDLNDAPVLSGANDFTTITEDQTNNNGDLVSTLIAGTASDVDSGPSSGIAVTGFSSGGG